MLNTGRAGIEMYQDQLFPVLWIWDGSTINQRVREPQITYECTLARGCQQSTQKKQTGHSKQQVNKRTSSLRLQFTIVHKLLVGAEHATMIN